MYRKQSVNDPDAGLQPVSIWVDTIQMRNAMDTARLFCTLLLAALFALLASHSRAEIWVIDVQGAIGPASADHMVRGLEQAQESGAELVILLIDTPGGLDLAMREMIKSILAASVPLVGYVPVAPGLQVRVPIFCTLHILPRWRPAPTWVPQRRCKLAACRNCLRPSQGERRAVRRSPAPLWSTK